MKLLFIGYSNLLKNRIIPILNQIDFIDEVHIAKYKFQSWGDDSKAALKPFTLYDSYEEAFENFRGDVVYISSTNSSHFEWAKKSLQKAFHTIIDKPATLHLSETEELIHIAREKRILLSEATVYLYHPQMKIIKKYLLQNKYIPQNICFLFSFPSFKSDNFRYSKMMGGGAIYDTGPYLASLARYFYDDMPVKAVVECNYNADYEVEISYSAVINYSNGRSVIGYSGFNTEYINRLNILGDKFCIDLDRVYTIPDDMENTISIRCENKTEKVKVEAASLFVEYFKCINFSITNTSFEALYNDMLKDAMIRNLLK